MIEAGPLSERALILAPMGRDAQIAAAILAQAGMPTAVSVDLVTLLEEIDKGAGMALIADEAIRDEDPRPLAKFLASQPTWSDFPIILLTHRGGGPERNPIASKLARMLGNVTFLERPFHPMTLVSVARTAIRGRRRQYEARAQLEKLSEGEQRLQNALEAGELGSWTLKVEGMVLEASETCRAHFGRNDQENFSYEELVSSLFAEDVPRVEAALAKTFRSGGAYAVEHRNVWLDGSVHWVEMRARTLEDGLGRIDRLVGVSADITARKTAELERERLLRELEIERSALAELTRTLEERVAARTTELLAEVATRERTQEQLLQAQKMEVVGQLTGGVAHDFNNLLMAISGNLELLRKRLPDDPRTQRLIDGAMQGARRGASLTQRMLAFSRQQELKTSSADLVTLLVGVRELLERTLGPQIALTIVAPPGLPPAQVDANQIELAILNLVINARDAMPDGGEIRISVEKEEDGKRAGLSAKAYLRLSVADTGWGMDAATLKRAIEPFFSTKPPGKGTGLGLSMVHGLAVQLGGLLELSSKVGKGTTATLWLPIAATQSTIEVPQIDELRESRKATILVVEDDPLIAMSTVDMLEDLGHTVVEANSGKRALEILEGGRSVDMMMTDQAMPGMTGMELAKLVRRKHPSMPVLLVTGYADLPASQRSVLPRLSKPYRQSQLKAEIERLLESKA